MMGAYRCCWIRGLPRWTIRTRWVATCPISISGVCIHLWQVHSTGDPFTQIAKAWLFNAKKKVTVWPFTDNIIVHEGEMMTLREINLFEVLSHHMPIWKQMNTLSPCMKYSTLLFKKNCSEHPKLVYIIASVRAKTYRHVVSNRPLKHAHC